jgi:hypothetical protein
MLALAHCALHNGVKMTTTLQETYQPVLTASVRTFSRIYFLWPQILKMHRAGAPLKLCNRARPPVWIHETITSTLFTVYRFCCVFGFEVVAVKPPGAKLHVLVIYLMDGDRMQEGPSRASLVPKPCHLLCCPFPCPNKCS